MASGQTFISDLLQWNEATHAKREALARQSIQELALLVQYDTPVLTGFLRAMWQPSIGAPAPHNSASVTPGAIYPDDGGAKIDHVIATLRIGETFYSVNNARYGARVNWGFTGTDSLGRQYNQKGQFFLENALAQWPRIVEHNALDLQLS